ncbi:MAG: hypothetical protein AAGA72_09290 [Pseudomonadota bacterium]
MNIEQINNYVANLPIDNRAFGIEDESSGQIVDLDNLPDGIVTGGNLIQFSDVTSTKIKSAVALSLLAAQRVAKADSVLTTPDEWVERHNLVLSKLNWLVEESGSIDSEFEDVNVAVHEAILPFLTATLGATAAAGSLIITALKQMKEMNKDEPWITLFEKESRRFSVHEFHFSVVSLEDDLVKLRMAAARLDAKYGRTQVLFFTVTKERARFKSSKSVLTAQPSLLEMMNGALKAKMSGHTNEFIQSLP